VLLLVHSWWRWLVLLAGVVAVARMIAGSRKSSAWTPSDRRAVLVYVAALDLQVLLGVALFLVSPRIASALHDVAAAMAAPDVRAMLVDHPVAMLVALVLAHAGSIAARKAPSDQARFDRGALLLGLSVVLILLGIPWSRLLSPVA